MRTPVGLVSSLCHSKQILRSFRPERTVCVQFVFKGVCVKNLLFHELSSLCGVTTDKLIHRAQL